ncbi:DUF3379 family protein [Thalassotalea atypica]|uniref:DUF3379 family protein n=1 Tax=Thalassotalea atypica TaxID=2054316 RepID=UPI0025739BC8|nr:DUF3379 family protein [Thalassotalea atypica]
MDDLKFRRSLLADPYSQDPEFMSARKADASKQQYAQEIEILNSKIEQALNVPVPEDLCDHLILRQTMASHRQQKRKSRTHLALAASVAFAFGLIFNFMQFSSAYSGIDDYALAHVYHEVGSFDNTTDARVSLTSLNSKMASFDGRFSGTIGELISADYCRFDGIKSLHLVFQGKTSPVNVFVVPNRDEVLFSEQFSDAQLRGIAKQFGQQNVIIVGDKQESLNQWQQNLAKNIQWST